MKIINSTFTSRHNLFSAVGIRRLLSHLPENFYNNNDCSRLSDTKPIKLFNEKKIFLLKDFLNYAQIPQLFCYVLIMLPATGTFLTCNHVGFVELCYVVEHVLLIYHYYLVNIFIITIL